jgi:hypothetical protein
MKPITGLWQELLFYVASATEWESSDVTAVVAALQVRMPVNLISFFATRATPGPACAK